MDCTRDCLFFGGEGFGDRIPIEFAKFWRSQDLQVAEAYKGKPFCLPYRMMDRSKSCFRCASLSSGASASSICAMSQFLEAKMNEAKIKGNEAKSILFSRSAFFKQLQSSLHPYSQQVSVPTTAQCQITQSLVPGSSAHLPMLRHLLPTNQHDCPPVGRCCEKRGGGEGVKYTICGLIASPSKCVNSTFMATCKRAETE